MLQTEKRVQIKSQNGKSLSVVREHYIREEVPCHSDFCLAGCQHFADGLGGKRLPKDGITHYLVPDCRVSRELLEVLEVPEIKGIIFMQTVVHSVQHEGSRRLLKRLQSMVKFPSKGSAIFHNEFQQYSYCPRTQGETLVEWQGRNVYSGATWFYNHLAGQIPIIVVSEDQKFIEEFKMKTVGVHVISMKQYLTNFYADVPELMHLYESLEAALSDKTGKQKTDYTGYLPSEVLDSGLKTGKLIQGRLNVNKHNAQQEAFVTPTGVSTKGIKQENDIFVCGSAARNRAVHGDLVVVEMLPKNQWKSRSNALSVTQEDDDEKKENVENEKSAKAAPMPSGQIVGILQRGWRDYVASFAEGEEKQRKTGKVLVIPSDYRIPKIRISTRQADALKYHRILVRIDSWEIDSQYPNGHFVKSLGRAGELETEIAAILVENALSAGNFSEAQTKELPTNSLENPWVMTPEEIAERRDLRQSHLVFSIDPKGCEDVDDTLSVRKLPNGKTELGVHIADVTHFVKPDSLTDLEARKRSTTVYLADRRYDMLPAILSADLCSLISGVERYAMSVIWELDENYEVENVWYGRTLIKSRYKLFYEMAQAIHDGVDKEVIRENVPELQTVPEEELDLHIQELRFSIDQLMNIANHIRAKRTAGGALELEGVEVQVQIKDTDSKTVDDLIPKQPLEIHSTIAECMIFANHWVAKKICETFPDQALLRHHPLPRQEQFTALVECAKSKGFEIKTHSNKTLSDSLDQCVDPNDSTVNKLLRTLATLAMSNAAYFSTGSILRDQFFHYGLALDYYTHFTSPIRRYADVVVHRLLMCALGKSPVTDLFDNKELHNISGHMNTKHRNAQNAQRDSVELFQALYFKNREDETTVADAVVFQLRANGMLVYIPRYGLKGAVYLRSKEKQVLYIEKDDSILWTGGSISQTPYEITVNSTRGQQSYKIFDHITVQITVKESHAHTSNIRLELLKKKEHTATSISGGEKQGKSEIIKGVHADANEIEKTRSQIELGSEFDQLKKLYGQTSPEKSFYNLLQTCKNSALLLDV